MRALELGLGGRQIEACDTVLVLACDAACRVAERVFSKPCINPVITLGPGYLSEDGVPVSVGDAEGTLEDITKEKGLPAGPFV